MPDRQIKIDQKIDAAEIPESAEKLIAKSEVTLEAEVEIEKELKAKIKTQPLSVEPDNQPLKPADQEDLSQTKEPQLNITPRSEVRLSSPKTKPTESKEKSNVSTPSKVQVNQLTSSPKPVKEDIKVPIDADSSIQEAETDKLSPKQLTKTTNKNKPEVGVSVVKEVTPELTPKEQVDPEPVELSDPLQTIASTKPQRDETKIKEPQIVETKDKKPETVKTDTIETQPVESKTNKEVAQVDESKSKAANEQKLIEEEGTSATWNLKK